MASKTLGRVNCPISCGHTAAQVKLKTDKADGATAYPYVHCAGCGLQMHTRNADQARHLLAMTRAEKGAEAPASPPASAAPADEAPAPAAPPPRAGFLDTLFGGGLQP